MKCVCFSVSTGYFALFNATHYEFDVSVYSTTETILFEALILLEDPDVIQIVDVTFSGRTNSGGYVINGDRSLVFNEPAGNVLFNMTVTENKELIDGNDDVFDLSGFAVSVQRSEELTSSVILHIVGKLYLSTKMHCCSKCN